MDGRATRRRAAGLVMVLVTAACPTTPRGPGSAPVPATVVEVGAAQTLEGADGFREVYLTVMTGNLALVRERRAVELPAGVTDLVFSDVVDGLVPESTRVRLTTPRGAPEDVAFLEQRYRYDVLAPARLLELSLGSSVRLHWTQPRSGAERVLEGVIESTAEGLFLRTPDGTYTAAAPAGDYTRLRTVRERLPGALFSRPQLGWIVDAAGRTSGVVEASYLAHGMTWEADYVLTADEEFETAGLVGWVTVRNQTAGRFERAHLAVVAGDIHVAPETTAEVYNGFDDEDGAPYREAEESGYVEEGLFEYHLYKLPRPTTLPAYSWKQITFLTREELPIATKYEAEVGLQEGSYGGYVGTDDWAPVGVQRVITVANEAAVDGLGVPLPAGAARVYARSGDDLFFVDASNVEDTPREEPLELDAGGAPFLVVKTKLLDFRTSDAGAFGSYEVTRQQVRMVNRGSRPVTLVLRLLVPGWRYAGRDRDVRLERATGVDGPPLVEESNGVWECERTLAPDVETTDEFVLRIRRAY